MVLVLAAARPLKLRDARYRRTYELLPGEYIFDPYLVQLIKRAKIRLRLV